MASNIIVSVNQLSSAIAKILNEYADEVERTSDECVRKVAQKGAKAVRATSSSTFNGNKYASGWTYEVRKGRVATEGEIYNKNQPGLAHLLENGHVIRNGTGRTFGQTTARPHIKPVEEQIIADFERTIKADLS